MPSISIISFLLNISDFIFVEFQVPVCIERRELFIGLVNVKLGVGDLEHIIDEAICLLLFSALPVSLIN
jgi:hypothetical protein